MSTVTPPEISFFAVPNLVTCSEVIIQWTYNPIAPPTTDYPLVITNIGVDQSGFNRREYPLVSRQSTPVVNTTLATINASTGKFDWPKANIPQGWYRMNIYATAGIIPSNIFKVTNGLDVSCIVTPSQSSIPPNSSLAPPSTGSPSSTNGPPATTNSLAMNNPSAKRNAIVGGVVGGVAFFLLVAAFLVWLSRRMKAGTRNTTPSTKTGVQQFRGNHNPSDSTGAILSFDDKGYRGNPRRSSTSEEDYTFKKSTVVDHDTPPKFPLAATTISYSKPSTPGRRPTSMVSIEHSFESRESVQPRPSSSPSYSVHPPNRARRASRKPVPVYDLSEFSTPESSDIPLSDPPQTISGGARTYYLIPDPPLH